MRLRMGLAVGLSLAAMAVWSGEGKVVLGHGWDILDATTDDLLANVEALDKTGLDGVAICLRKGRRSDGTALNCTSMRGAPVWTEEAFEADGRYYMILSDGMGTGREAALTSGIAVSMLERLLKSGAELECALKMLNHIIRSAGRECSATVDIAEIDLMSGCARFIKSGAAPSFVLRDGSIFRLQSKTVPIGIIRALDAELIKFEIKAGDTIVMVSDGAARSYDEAPWLLDLMTYDSTIADGDEVTAAQKIVAEARKHGSADDITAGIIRLKAV